MTSSDLKRHHRGRHLLNPAVGHDHKNHPLAAPDHIEAIKFRMEQQGLTRKNLEDIIGTRTRIAEVVNRKRSLSIDMIRRLHGRLGISVYILIQSYCY